MRHAKLRSLDVEIAKSDDDRHSEVVKYNCPACGYRNTHFWFGREFHYCSQCDYGTDTKGQTK